ncbi:IS5/IS1182 family transposase [Lipingzhangella sp. LS1_29]|uniref:IS5/IS1182 family transposase n=1 Tax=Lipingzhangella rawalii TaxID=2055835 RepID=A0ABU2HAC0_9ACTN|nr:IS5/IS1182 family transposase [Lipingzhangella rawalii]MDS1272275.1 IS5/IS1182 family transposase [Lipingzhangella rawalii]
MATDRAILDVPRDVVRFLSRLRAGERRLRRTPIGSRALTCFDQAVVVLRHDCEATSPAVLARDAGVGCGTAHLILDGIVLPTDRCADTTLSVNGERIVRGASPACGGGYSGTAHPRGATRYRLMDPRGFPLFLSDAEPGSVPNLTAARIDVLPARSPAATHGLATRAELGDEGAGIGIITPVSQREDGRPRATGIRAFHRLQRALRCLGESDFALLTQRWRCLLHHIHTSPSTIADITTAALVRTHVEHGRPT